MFRKLFYGRYSKLQFKPYTVVRMTKEAIKVYKEGGWPMPLKPDETAIFVNDIRGMEGHSILMKWDGKLLLAWHTDNFEEVPEEEL